MRVRIVIVDATWAGLLAMLTRALSVRVRYYRWALREVNPTHPDVPRIVLRLRELEGR